jgi:hypothetical protein
MMVLVMAISIFLSGWRAGPDRLVPSLTSFTEGEKLQNLAYLRPTLKVLPLRYRQRPSCDV